MDNQCTSQEEVGQILHVHFPLRDKPLDVQLTVHINNMLNCYGKDVIKEFKLQLNDPESQDIQSRQIVNIINHYGIENVKQWFEVVYGWEFKKAG